jgi:HAD superfamily phosphoserine phosphatase-like hydrolase
MQWKNRKNDTSFSQYESVLIDAYLKTLQQIPVAAYQKIIDKVFEEYKDQLFVYSRDLLNDLKQKGYLLFAISGSHDDIVQKFASYHGFDAAIGAELTLKDGAFTGKIKTPVHSKYDALKKLLAQYDVCYINSIAVGDTASDVAILERVANPIAFNPDKTLYNIAKERGWKIVVERKNVIYEIAKEA